MKVIFFIISLFFINSLFAQDSTKTQEKEKNQTGKQIHKKIEFVDENNDGYNDNAPDHDGDGIPNGLDPDYLALKKKSKQKGKVKFVDLDGDGINDIKDSEDEELNPEQLRSREAQPLKQGSLNEQGQQQGKDQKKRKGKND